MAAEKATALVIRLVEFSESSLVVTLFTREFGKVEALAKGARRLKGPFESALDLLAVCRIVFLAKSSDALDLLTEAKLERRFRTPSRDLSSLYAAYYVAELLNELTEVRDPHPELFDAACQTLAALAAGKTVAAEVLRFELATLRLLGHLPSLDECVGCGQPVLAVPREGESHSPGTAQRVAFGLLAGGVLCHKCRPGKKQVVSLSIAALTMLSEFADPRRSATAQWQRAVAGELRGVLNQYLYNLLGRKPRMHAYLNVLSGG